MNESIYKGNGTNGVSLEESIFTCTQYKDTNIQVCYAEEMSDLAKEEAHHHDHDDEDATDVHQLDAWRNEYYHAYIWKVLQGVEKGSRLLEIGAGSGYDAKHLIDDYSVVLTDVSPETLFRLQQSLGDKANRVSAYLACDGEHLPFADKQFEGVYMIAVFHHFEQPARALAECSRVLKPGGRLLLGIEPNMTYFRPLKWFQKILYRITHTDPHHISQADAQMIGFSKGQFSILLKNGDWKDISIKPMWFLVGWLHYILEFVYRAFKLKKRIRISRKVEKMLVSIDEFLFKIPGVKYLCWHWIVTARKK